MPPPVFSTVPVPLITAIARFTVPVPPEYRSRAASAILTPEVLAMALPEVISRMPAAIRAAPAKVLVPASTSRPLPDLTNSVAAEPVIAPSIRVWSAAPPALPAVTSNTRAS